MSGAQEVEQSRRHRALPDRREPLHHDRHPDAEAVRRQRPGSQRVRHGTHPEHASITVTTGLLELMTDRELEGVHRP